MTASRLRLALALLALGALPGCATKVTWPAPEKTAELRLRAGRREATATVTLGDALHVVFPPPTRPGTQWVILLLNTRILRQMTTIGPAADGPPGSEEVSFQAIRTTARTTVRFAAIDPKSSEESPEDTFTLNVGIPRRPLPGLPAK